MAQASSLKDSIEYSQKIVCTYVFKHKSKKQEGSLILFHLIQSANMPELVQKAIRK